MRTITIAAALLLAPLCGGATAVEQPAAVLTVGSASAAALSTLPWPARIAVASGLSPETLELKAPGWEPKGTIEPVSALAYSAHLTSRENGAVVQGQGKDWTLFCERAASKLDGWEPQFERPGAFLFVDAEGAAAPASSSNSAAFMFKFISARPPAVAREGEPLRAVVERTWFAFYDPLPPKAAAGVLQEQSAPAPRGLVVFMPGMFGTPGDQIVALIRRLRQDGYSVLRMMAQPARFTESVTYSLPLEGDFSNEVPAIAAELTDRAAEAAYAVESAVLYANQQRPALRSLPRMAVGMSGGAMLLPIVIAREPGAYAGAVSIAGGVDYLQILATSNYTNWIDAVRLKWTGGPALKPASDGGPPPLPGPSAQRLEELIKAYRAAAPLDSSKIAPLVKNVPWLLLHGTKDKAVPAATGEELWELLGRPERIVIKGGHEWVFLTLSSRFNAIAAWMNARAPAPPLPPAESSR
ncbi:MAG: alpha/beta hydrolase [Phycisphaerales bacterium]|nr:alpha/beta hydrolase [Phycisphaerales bacterium]